jgi:hypothetical protein
METAQHRQALPKRQFLSHPGMPFCPPATLRATDSQDSVCLAGRFLETWQNQWYNSAHVRLPLSLVAAQS